MGGSGCGWSIESHGPEAGPAFVSVWRAGTWPRSVPGGLESGMTGRMKVVLYNPRAVFFTMPLALLAIGSELDPEIYEVVTIDGRLDADAEATLVSQLD